MKKGIIEIIIQTKDAHIRGRTVPPSTMIPIGTFLPAATERKIEFISLHLLTTIV